MSWFLKINVLVHWIISERVGGTYAHPFPLQQNEVGDFFGHESILAI